MSGQVKGAGRICLAFPSLVTVVPVWAAATGPTATACCHCHCHLAITVKEAWLPWLAGTRFVRIAKSPAAPAAAFAYAVTAGGLQLLEGVEAPPTLLAAGSVVDRPITNEVPYEQEEAFAMAE